MNAKSLITGQKDHINEAPEGEGVAPLGGAGGVPPMRQAPPMRPGGPPKRRPGPGPGEGPGGPGPSPKEKMAMMELVILDLLFATGGDKFYTEIVQTALKGGQFSPQMIQHFMDEAPKYADQMSPEVNAFMEKLASMPRH